MQNGYGFDDAIQEFHAKFQRQKSAGVLIENVKLKKVMRQSPVADRMFGVDPLSEQDETVF